MSILLAIVLTPGAAGPASSSTPDAGVGEITFELGSGTHVIADTPENAGEYPPPPPGLSIWMEAPGVDLRTPSEDGYGNLSGFYYVAGPTGKRHDLYAEIEFDQTTRITRNVGDNLFSRYTSQDPIGHLIFQSNEPATGTSGR